MKIGILNTILLLFSICLFIATLYEPLRDALYLLPAFAFIPFFAADKSHLKYTYFSYFYTFIIFYGVLIAYLLVRVILIHDLNYRFFPNAVFILSPLLFLFFLIPFFNQRKIRRYVKLAFILTLVIFAVQQFKNFLPVISDFSLLKQAILSSTIETENQLAFSLGLFLFYFLTEKYPKRYIIVCLIIFVLSFKRIALGSFVLSYLLFILFGMLKTNVQQRRYLFVLLAVVANFIYLEITFLIVDGALDDLVKEYTNFSTNRFLLGRQVYYQVVLDKVGTISWSGLGLGKIDNILFSTFNGPQNLHSDILKNYLEFGVVLFTLWLIVLYLKGSFSREGLAITIYFNVLMFTDNVFIYFDFMFFFYFFILIYRSKMESKREEQGQGTPAFYN